MHRGVEHQKLHGRFFLVLLLLLLLPSLVRVLLVLLRRTGRSGVAAVSLFPAVGREDSTVPSRGERETKTRKIGGSVSCLATGCAQEATEQDEPKCVMAA